VEKGFSGGPLLDSQGRLVGVTKGTFEGSIGALKLAIPASTVVAIVNETIDNNVFVKLQS
jgi:S1-C subfamily serine protease